MVKKTSVIVSVAAAASLIFSILRGPDTRWWFLPLSVLFGGGVGLLNFRWLATAVERVYLRKGTTPGLSNLAAAIINVLKLTFIFIILFIVIKWRLLHILGFVAGLSLCFIAIIWEGATLMKHALNKGES